MEKSTGKVDMIMIALLVNDFLRNVSRLPPMRKCREMKGNEGVRITINGSVVRVSSKQTIAKELGRKRVTGLINRSVKS